jgi:hypothetical protein
MMRGLKGAQWRIRDEAELQLLMSSVNPRAIEQLVGEGSLVSVLCFAPSGQHFL